MPPLCCPLPRGVREVLRSSSIGEMGEKALGVPGAIGSAPSRQQARCFVGGATQVSCSAQANGIEKEHREQQTAPRARRWGELRMGSPGQTGDDGTLEMGKQPRLMSGGNQEQPTRLVLPVSFRG
jgi:hypothetical protein